MEQVSWTAHKYSYHLHKGVVPKGMYVCHTCDNRLCVNPDHLFLGTPSDNVQDMLSKNRQRKTKVPFEVIQAIRKDDRSQKEIAKAYGISPGHVCRLRRRDYIQEIQSEGEKPSIQE